MTVEELRIGNYVSTGNGVAYSEEKVTSIETFVSEQFKIGFNNRVDVKYYCDDIKPIPLTEQWLFDFGFKKNHNKYFFDDWIILEIEDGDWLDPSLDVFIKRPHQKEKCYLTCVFSVHELQNLFYAVSSGEELTIKEKV